MYEMLYILLFSWVTPVSWFVLVLTVILSLFIKRLWIISIITVPISILLFVFYMSGRNGLLSFSLDFWIKTGIVVAVISVFIIWIGRLIGNKLGLSLNLDEKEENDSNGHL
jgi:hypothetical protein